ncbi:FAD:protein FMN transferase [Sphingomonas qomolangmaensis]|uniref:FAD:protein FMN transferase n=1 Tax=Sphingomonas qomolangmaensis TaxID=2918765 RepID=A0ABY5LBJ5_9SPHN|nr:FAD:protein FMN transferase [Sphingomonas qomolangmaensis]UUL82051.1 FAD:protein FMN transferase [Sphingomonas qomolangmaensis]
MHVALPALVAPEAFARRDAAARIARFGGEAMGTSWSALVVAPPPGLEAELWRTIDAVIASMSQWRPDSALSAFNRAPIGEWWALPADLAEVLATAVAIGGASDGAFDPACGALADLWGFGPPGPRTSVPSPREVTDALARSGTRHLELDARRARRHARIALDLSGIAKGHAVDRLAATCRAAGAQDFLVEIGGEYAGGGIRPDGQPWWVAVEAPPGLAANLRIGLHDLAVATSGDYRRFVAQDGHRFGHSIDPRTGWPIDNGIVSATVVAADCMSADGWATALTVLGGDAAMATAERNGVAAQLRAGDGREWITPALAAMLS